ncbi:hypothetical protein ACQ856_18315 [Mycolicibacterium psychrotolerans]|uniref:hypothetical protein n=1 Tax=Mycolicibacterium psychrotolerans TaxID=216929 RepID=UPI003D67EBD6
MTGPRARVPATPAARRRPRDAATGCRRPGAETRASGEKGGQNTGEKGAAPAKKAVKRAPAGTKRAAAGAKPSLAAKIRAELGSDRDPVGTAILVRQAARVAERLENIDALLSGDAKAWLRFGIPRDLGGGRMVVELHVTDLVKEERQQTGALRTLLAEVHRQRSGQPADPPDPTKEDDDLDVD